MKILSISLKNVAQNPWRTLTLGSFIFVATTLLVLSSAFILTIRANAEETIISTLTGAIQVRPGSSEETDMFSLKGNWGEIAYLDEERAAEVERVLKAEEDTATYTKLVRHNTLLSLGSRKESVMVIGLEPGTEAYEKFVKLESGTHLKPNDGGQAILTPEQAENLKVAVGDKIVATSLNRDKMPVQVELTVAGIGQIELMELFSFAPVYVDLKSAQTLLGLSEQEATDIVVYLPNRGEAEAQASALAARFRKADLTESDVKLSTWKDMGGFVLSSVSIYIVMFYAGIGVLLAVIGLLIINLVSMIGMERRPEIGMLRAIGFSRSHIVVIFMGEVLLIALLFFVLGAGVGLGLGYTFSQVGLSVFEPLSYVTGKLVYLQFTFSHILPAALVIFGISFLSALFPSLTSASQNPVEILKEV
jgi:putative ABC transport system permease protein